MDAVHEINTLGIILNHCSPHNVIVRRKSHEQFIIDLAQCWFKDKMIKRWLEDAKADWEDDKGSDLKDNNGPRKSRIGSELGRVATQGRFVALWRVTVLPLVCCIRGIG
ncbi:hypothetical protein BKA56DRAFT_560015 [Ilyonectria sp. MPI-CAGE-AT-0026]|nr:hypothetical protein BKA56DRAFT_565386 [Ilyonectria sp. MPI-CAGE-AT-0026]KAH6962324.1 hypothetical protein BKA56DRAFT_560015 [Ilyonectria sp. MPI-CAGE-AT-0026]